MTRIKNAALALAGIVALAVPSLGMAQGMSMKGPDSAWYVGGSFGQSKIDCDVSALPGASCDDSDTAYRAFGGYQFNKNLAVELGYHKLGEARLSGVGGSATIEATSWDLVAVGILPVSEQFSCSASSACTGATWTLPAASASPAPKATVT